MAIPQTEKLFADLKTLALDLTAISLAGVSFESVSKVFAVIGDVGTVLTDVPGALSELVSLGEEEEKRIADLVKEIGECVNEKLK